MRRQTFK